MKILSTPIFLGLTTLLVGLLLVACGSTPRTGELAGASQAPAVTAAVTAAPSSTTAPTPTTAPTNTPIPEATPEIEAHSHMQMPDATAAPAEASAAAQAAADIKLFQFKPEPLQVAVGTTVVWTNHDDIEHSVTHGTPAAPGGAFDSDLFAKGQTFAFTFTQPGEYPYFCSRHNSMQGRVIVAAAAGVPSGEAAVAQAEPAPPERLMIPQIGLDVAPVAVGLDEQRLPVVPRHDVGWFTGSAQLGQGSNVIFWGHVLRWKETPATPAPFERLHELRPGAEITVFSNREPKRYQVTEQIQTRPENVAYLLPTAEEQLTFVSCIGDNVIVTGTLTKEFRLVTIAKPIG